MRRGTFKDVIKYLCIFLVLIFGLKYFNDQQPTPTNNDSSPRTEQTTKPTGAIKKSKASSKHSPSKPAGVIHVPSDPDVSTKAKALPPDPLPKSQNSPDNQSQQGQGNSSQSQPRSQAQAGTFNTLDPNEHHKWPTNHINCYLKTGNPKIRQAYLNAINKWNSTGAFHFNLVNNPKAAITLSEKDLSPSRRTNGINISQELGVTYTTYPEGSINFYHVDVYLDNSNMLMSHDMHYITEVAEHELGHAIGLAHTPENANSVMVPYNPKTEVTNNDVTTVKQLYGVK